MAYMAQAIRKGIRKQKFKYAKTAGTAYHWTYVLRAKDPKKRELIAKDMERAVKKANYIKYSNESKKNAKLYDAVDNKKFNCSKVTKRTYTNCCNLVSVACNFAGIPTPRKSSARTMPTKWAKYDFEIIPYKHGTTKLLRGDILDATIKPKVHAAVYLG